MPSSYVDNIAPIIFLVADLHPKSVMDIGPGRGKYGFLLREYLDPETGGDWEPIEKIDCIEIFEGYVQEYYQYLYDNIYIGDALDFEFEQYDLYLMIDCIEHMPKDRALGLLRRLTKKGMVLISTPTDIGDQGESHGNKHEAHISQWGPEDFSEFTMLADDSNSYSYLYVIT